MCGFRRMPNNCCVVIVPAVPIQAGCGAPVGVPNFGGGIPAMPNMAPNCMPNNAGMFGAEPNAMMPNAAVPNNIVPSGTMPGGNLSGFTCNANFETTQRCMEPPLQCPPTTIHHHNRVQHMVPCIKTNIHHIHNHHEWLPFEQNEVNQVVNHSHGVRPPDQQLCNSVR